MSNGIRDIDLRMRVTESRMEGYLVVSTRLEYVDLAPDEYQWHRHKKVSVMATYSGSTSF